MSTCKPAETISMVNTKENIFLNMILNMNIEIIFINNQDQFIIQSNKIRN